MVKEAMEASDAPKKTSDVLKVSESFPILVQSWAKSKVDVNQTRTRQVNRLYLSTLPAEDRAAAAQTEYEDNMRFIKDYESKEAAQQKPKAAPAKRTAPPDEEPRKRPHMGSSAPPDPPGPHADPELLGKDLEGDNDAAVKVSRKERQDAIDALSRLRYEDLPPLGPFDLESILPRTLQAIEPNLDDDVCTSNERKDPVRLQEILQAASLSFGLVLGLKPSLPLSSMLEILAALFTQNANQQLHQFHSAVRKSAIKPAAQCKDTTESDTDVLTAMAANQARLSQWKRTNVEFNIRRMLSLIEMFQLYQDFYSKYERANLKKDGKEARKKMSLPSIRHDDVNAIISMTFARIYHEQRLPKTVDTLYKEFSDNFRADLSRGRVLGEIQNHLGTGALVLLSATKRWMTNTAKARPDTVGVVLQHLLLRWPNLRMHDYLHHQLWEPFSLGRSLDPGHLAYELYNISLTTYHSLQPCADQAMGNTQARADLSLLEARDMMEHETAPGNEDQEVTSEEASREVEDFDDLDIEPQS